MRTWLFALFLACAAALVARGARAQDDAAAASDALFHRAEQEDAAGDYARALDDYKATIARLPSTRWAAKATARAQLLAAHAEGDWKPFARLEAARRDPHFADDPAAVDALARDADAFPDGPTRGEARMVCADAWLRSERRGDGEAALRKVIDDARADALLRRQAASLLVGTIEQDGDAARARDVARSLGTLLDPKVAKRAAILARRAWLHRAAIADVAIVALLVAIAVARAAAHGALGDAGRALRRSTPIAAAFAAWVALAGGALASGYESGNAAPFFAFGAALLPIALASRAWGAIGSRAAVARALRSAACASAVLAAALLVLEAVNADYLEGFGL